RLFTHGRRLLGVRLKLTVLLVAEVVAAAFYTLLASRLPQGSLRSGLEELAADEAHHLRFHGDFFALQPWGPLGRALWKVGWWALSTAAVLVVLVDHHRTLRALGIPLGEAVQAFGALSARAARAAQPGEVGLDVRFHPGLGG
ncbi:MAG TPA: hypothetical protein VLQ93_26050, partial [Myxococcaceae bacterium]|nr:hypothetical protein [Myxococcaceae bacterium]